jgi:hypothetical protein
MHTPMAVQTNAKGGHTNFKTNVKFYCTKQLRRLRRLAY